MQFEGRLRNEGTREGTQRPGLESSGLSHAQTKPSKCNGNNHTAKEAGT
jgi:hypothetical protein